MFDFSLNSNAAVSQVLIGVEQSPLLIIDDFANAPNDLVDYAGDGSLFRADSQNFYPGKRKVMPEHYGAQLCQHYFPHFANFFQHHTDGRASTIMSALAIADTKAENLRPMQMLPHIDTPKENQYAVVHYLCAKEHGGTAFYRHRSTAVERVTQAKLFNYASQVKKEAMANQIHKNPCYMSDSNDMFEQLYSVAAKFNRAIIYPSNLLHSGNINTALGLSSQPKQGRLTIGSFILVD